MWPSFGSMRRRRRRSTISFFLFIHVKMTKSSVFLLLKVGQVCLLRHSFFFAPYNALLYTYTAASHGFYAYSLLYPIRAVCCSKLPKLPPDQCCVAFQGTEATTRSLLYAVWSYHSLYVGTCTTTFYYLTLLTVTCLRSPSAAFTREGSPGTFPPPPSTCFTSLLAIAPHLCTVRPDQIDYMFMLSDV